VLVRSILVPLLLVFSPALAFYPAAKVSEARAEVIYVGGYLRDGTLAQALLEALKRGVVVKLYTSSYTYLDDRSYFLGLYLAGAKLYLGLVPRYYLVVDGVPVAWGEKEGDLREIPPEAAPTVLNDLKRVQSSSLGFALPPDVLTRALLERARRSR
jgi:hypothetical protein